MFETIFSGYVPMGLIGRLSVPSRQLRCEIRRTNEVVGSALAQVVRPVRIVRCALIAATLLAPGGAWAACHFTSGGFTAFTFAVPATIVVPRDALNNAVIGSYERLGEAVGVNCSSDLYGVINSAGAAPGFNETLMPIGSTGISWRWSFRTRNSFEPVYGSQTLNGTDSITKGQQRIELVKTGTIAAGAIVPALLGLRRYGMLDVWLAQLSNPIAVTAPSCSTSDVDVPLGTHKASDFSGIGSSSSQVAFSIGLVCPNGIQSIRYQVNPTGRVINPSLSIVALDTGSVATGVGVQLLNGAGTAPLPLSVFQPVSGYAGAAGTYSIPLRARYYQTESSVTGGIAKSTMTFTMSYE